MLYPNPRCFHQIRRSARIRQNSSPRLTNAYLTDTNPHFLRGSSEPTTHFACLAQALQSEIEEPKSYEEALTCAEWKQWESAMKEEYNSLLENLTWDEVEAPSRLKILRGKWVYKIKRGSSGEITRFKAR